MKGIILAGGSGTRLYPLTLGVSKQLMPIYDKPMIYYPISTLFGAGIKEILVITTPYDRENFERLLGDGSQWGAKIQYKTQEKPNGIAEAFLIGEDFIGKEEVCLILGDNIFYGQGLNPLLQDTVKKVEKKKRSVVFGYEVRDPERYGVVDFDEDKKALSFEEKPKNPKSNFAVVGLYFYTNDVVEKAKNLKPSPRGELEVTDLSRAYLAEGKLDVEILNRGFAWLDTGTHESMLDAANFVEVIEKRQGLKIGCPEEIAWKKGWISGEQVKKLAEPLKKSDYGHYLLKLVSN